LTQPARRDPARGHDVGVPLPEPRPADQPPAVAHPSATLVLLRDGSAGIETLLVRRNARLDFHGGAWVFPGGRIDDEDSVGEVDELTAARRAAVRELGEEAGLTVAPELLVHVSTWTTPDIAPKRFRTLFFVAPGDGAVHVDGGEIHDHRWVAPQAALAARRAGELELPPPQHVTLLALCAYASVEEAVRSLAGLEPLSFAPRFVQGEGGAVCLYEGDAGYETRELDVDGPRHRLWLIGADWRYERS
jgi:8-oxo-dGTP pyrophosphatase MutT (NUDIX family)